MLLGEKIQQLRKERGLSQEQLASRITVSRQAISKWELGEATPDVENVIQLSNIFGVSTDYLLKTDNESRLPSASDTSDSGVAGSGNGNHITKHDAGNDPISFTVSRFRRMAVVAAILAAVGFVTMLEISYVINRPPLGFGLQVIWSLGGAGLLAAAFTKVMLYFKTIMHSGADMNKHHIDKAKISVWRAFFGAVCAIILMFFVALPLFIVRNVILHYNPTTVGDVIINQSVPELNVLSWMSYVLSIPTMMLAAGIVLLLVFVLLRKKLGFQTVKNGWIMGLFQCLLLGIVFVLHTFDSEVYGLIVALACLAVFIFAAAYYSVCAHDNSSRRILTVMSVRNLLLAFPLLLLMPVTRYIAAMVGDYSFRNVHLNELGVIKETDILRLISYIDVWHLVYTALVLSGYALIKRRILSVENTDTSGKKMGMFTGGALKMKGLFCIMLAAVLLIAGIGVPNLWLSRHNEMMDDLFIKPLRAVAGETEVIDRSLGRRDFSELYTFRDSDGFFYEIGVQSSMSWDGTGGFITINYPGRTLELDGRAVTLGDYDISLRIHPRLSGEWSYVLSLRDITRESARSGHILGHAVDSDGSPLSRHPEDTDEFFQKWTELYTMLNEPIMELFSHVKGMFGGV